MLLCVDYLTNLTKTILVSLRMSIYIQNIMKIGTIIKTSYGSWNMCIYFYVSMYIPKFLWVSVMLTILSLKYKLGNLISFQSHVFLTLYIISLLLAHIHISEALSKVCTANGDSANNDQ